MYKIEKYFEELFRRIIFFIFSLILTLSFFYWWSFDLFLFLSESLFQENDHISHEFFSESSQSFRNSHQDSIHKFIFTDITEAFQTSLGISFLSTLCLQIPFFVYTIWAFLVPSFFKQERKIFTFFSFLFLGVYSLACLLMMNVVFPKVWEFFLTFQLYDLNPGFQSFSIECEPRISSFRSFLWKTFLFTQVIFQIPFWLFVSLFYHIIDLSFFFDHRRFFYWILLCFCALTAPPDFFLQFFLSLFFLCFFEMILFSALILHTYRHHIHKI